MFEFERSTSVHTSDLPSISRDQHGACHLLESTATLTNAGGGRSIKMYGVATVINLGKHPSLKC